MKNIDLKKEFRALYCPSKNEVSIVDVPTMNYLVINGSGNPNTSPRYQSAIEAIYAVSYALKYMVKKSNLAINYSVMPLEGLWWAKSGKGISLNNKDDWCWTAMIMQPEWITKEMVIKAIDKVSQKKQLDILSECDFISIREGKAAQIMYIEPYQNEEPTIQKIHAYIKQIGGNLFGKHHEIYLNDPRRTAPERLKTIIRQPFIEKNTG